MIKEHRVAVWAKVRIIAEVRTPCENEDDIVHDVCAQIVDMTKLRTAQFGNLIDPEISIAIPEKIEIFDNELGISYSRDIDMTEWAELVFPEDHIL